MKILQIIWDFYVIGCITFTTIFLFNLIRHLRKAVATRETFDEIRQQIKLVYTEHVGDAYYLYDHSNQFIAHGATEDEMWTKAKLLFPTKEFIIEGKDGKAVIVDVKGKE
jgi:hypothetical protein